MAKILLYGTYPYHSRKNNCACMPQPRRNCQRCSRRARAWSPQL